MAPQDSFIDDDEECWYVNILAVFSVPNVSLSKPPPY
jgi:hypothetical protein